VITLDVGRVDLGVANEGTWYGIADGAQSVDVAGPVATRTLIASGTPRVGTFDSLRVHLNGGTLTTAGGTTFALDVGTDPIQIDKVYCVLARRATEIDLRLNATAIPGAMSGAWTLAVDPQMMDHSSCPPPGDDGDDGDLPIDNGTTQTMIP
jgi:hypothetical protein